MSGPEWLPSPNQRARPAGVPIDMLILHYTGMQSAEAAIARLRDPDAAVSSHYVVDEDGGVVCLVDEGRRAAHAGVSFWRGHEDLNDRSVGIEIVNPGHEWGYRAFPEAQIRAVEELCAAILARHPMPACNVVGHSDVAPDRKQDPGELFPWRRLAERGIGRWPDVDGGDLTRLADAGRIGDGLVAIGYRLDGSSTLPVVLTAFQRHWRQQAVTGVADVGTLQVIEELAGLGWLTPARLGAEPLR